MEINPTKRNYLNETLNDALTEKETREYYAGWSGRYDEDMVTSDYNGPRYICDAFDSLGLDKGVRILDVLAGTGVVSQLLKERGYYNMDALDGCQEMLDKAMKKNTYNNYICSFIGKGHNVPIADETYDALVMSGAFGPGHIHSSEFPELLRITKRGGYICWAMRATHGERCPKFRNFHQEVNNFVETGDWSLDRYNTIKNYRFGIDGFIYILKKLNTAEFADNQ